SYCIDLFVECLDHQLLLSFPTRRSSDLCIAMLISDQVVITDPLWRRQHEACFKNRPGNGHFGDRDLRASRRAVQDRAYPAHDRPDRKSTRLNSSHVKISYAVFCLKKKRK